MICEGSYPYVTGGVSSWVDMLIRSMPEHRFLLYCIGAEEKNRGDFRYSLPANVAGVEEVFLDRILKEPGTFNRKFRLTDAEEKNIKNLILGESPDIFQLRETVRGGRIADFFMCEAFFNIVLQAYREKYDALPFTEFFWTIRSMLLPLFFIAAMDLPQADLYHSVSTGYAGIAGSIASLSCNRPFVLTEHGIYTREREEEIIKARWVKDYFKDIWIRFFYTLSRCTYENATRVVTLFQKNAEIEAEIGCPEEKISVVPNGIDVEEFSRIPDERSKTVLRIGAMLRVVPIKDVKTMLQSFAYVASKVENCEFLIMGSTEEEPSYYDECKELAKELRLRNVVFTGAVDVRDYLGRIDILVLSSISEGQPLAVLEGMASRIPCVTTNVGSCGELLHGSNDGFGEAGILVPLMDYVGMGKAIVRLCRQPELRRLMGQNGFQRVSSLYTKDRFIGKYKEIYQECMGL